MHPLGTAPVITDGDITIAESGAVVGAFFIIHGVASASDQYSEQSISWENMATTSLRLPTLGKSATYFVRLIIRVRFQSATLRPQAHPFLIKPCFDRHALC